MAQGSSGSMARPRAAAALAIVPVVGQEGELRLGRGHQGAVRKALAGGAHDRERRLADPRGSRRSRPGRARPPDRRRRPPPPEALAPLSGRRAPARKALHSCAVVRRAPSRRGCARRNRLAASGQRFSRPGDEGVDEIRPGALAGGEADAARLGERARMRPADRRSSVTSRPAISQSSALRRAGGNRQCGCARFSSRANSRGEAGSQVKAPRSDR